jgi:hypothetical protein
MDYSNSCKLHLSEPILLDWSYSCIECIEWGGCALKLLAARRTPHKFLDASAWTISNTIYKQERYKMADIPGQLEQNNQSEHNLQSLSDTLYPSYNLK